MVDGEWPENEAKGRKGEKGKGNLGFISLSPFNLLTFSPG
jgi:hypothetical protein